MEGSERKDQPKVTLLWKGRLQGYFLLSAGLREVRTEQKDSGWGRGTLIAA